MIHCWWGDPPHVTSPMWGPSPPCKQALKLYLTHSLLEILPKNAFWYGLKDLFTLHKLANKVVLDR